MYSDKEAPYVRHESRSLLLHFFFLFFIFQLQMAHNISLNIYSFDEELSCFHDRH